MQIDNKGTGQFCHHHEFDQLTSMAEQSGIINRRMKKHMRRLLILLMHICSSVICSSCTEQKTKTDEILDHIEYMLSVHPDSTLSMIESIDPSSFESEKQQARYSLIRAIVWDKNQIDVCSDSIIADAVSYYSQKGSEAEKARTFYYTARVFENAGNEEKAMHWLIKSERAGCSAGDEKLLALIFAAKGRIYYKVLDYKEAADNYMKAAEKNLSTENLDRYYANMLRKADCHIMNKEYDSARQTLAPIRNNQTDLSIRNLNRMYQGLINLAEKTSNEDIAMIRNEYLDVITDPSLIDWVMVAGTYIITEDAVKALDALENQKKYRGENAAYHYRKAQAQLQLGNHESALRSYMKYDMLSGEIGRKILSDDTRFIEEKEFREQQIEKEKTKSAILGLAISVGILLLISSFMFIMIIRRRLISKESENAKLRKQFDDLMMEREELSKADIRNAESMRIINERLRIIDQFVMSEALNDSLFEEKASQTLNGIINDRKEFIRQTHLIFSTSCPRFIKYLNEKGLDEKEMEICCLYAIGLNGKMVTSFTNVKRHYHIGSDIRKKLGLSGHDTNLSIYIRNLLEELEYLGN